MTDMIATVDMTVTNDHVSELVLRFSLTGGIWTHSQYFDHTFLTIVVIAQQFWAKPWSQQHETLGQAGQDPQLAYAPKKNRMRQNAAMAIKGF